MALKNYVSLKRLQEYHTLNKDLIEHKVSLLSTLPTVTESDNGKILQVVNGQWALVDPATLVTDDGNGNVTLGGGD